MKKLRIFLLVSSIEYFDYLLVKNDTGNWIKKSLFSSLLELKSANIFFLFELNIIAHTRFSHCSKGKGADETVTFGRNSCPPILAMKKLWVFLLVSSIEYFDHLLVKNYAGNGFEKSFFLVYPSLKMQIFIFAFF